MTYRMGVQEVDESTFVSPVTNETGAMSLISAKGKNTPVLVQDTTDLLTRTGNPSATYSSVFEAVSFVSAAPLWIVCPYGTNSLWGGVQVTSSATTAFTFGQVNPDTSFDFELVNVLRSGVVQASVASGQVTFTASLANTPIMNNSLSIEANGTVLDISESLGVISGTDIDTGTNTLNKTNGALAFQVKAGVVTTGQQIVAKWAAKEDLSATISHAFFSASPCTDDLSISIDYVSGTKFTLSLYQLSSTGVYTAISDHVGITYSLTRELDAFRKSIYIEDVFKDDPYLIPVINEAFTGTTYTVDDTYVNFDGGYRETALTSDVNTAWEQFLNYRKYPAKIFMDATGGYASKINSVIQVAQPRSHGITVLTFGNSVSESASERSGLSLDSDNINIYDCWFQIQDPYNNSYAWISNVGSIGKKFAAMEDVYDSGHPAGIDEDGHGGQMADWKYVQAEKDYTDADLQTLDLAQINPVIFDPAYGVMIYGNKTAQVTLSDTSYTGARRAYNFLIENVTTQVLRKQEFKNNDASHRNRARILTDDFITTTLGAVGAFAEWYVQCDTKNNTDAIRNQRKFILDIFVKVTPDSEFITLRVTRLSQNAVIADFVK